MKGYIEIVSVVLGKGGVEMNGVYLIVSTALIIVGVLGIFIPGLPGTGLVFIGTLVYAWATGFQAIGWGTLLIFLLLTLLAMGVDYIAGLLTAQKFGASKQGIIGSVIGGILGLIIFSLPGLILGQLAGVIAGELMFGRKMKESMKSGLGVFIGYLLGSLVKVIITTMMIIVFYFKVLF